MKTVTRTLVTKLNEDGVVKLEMIRTPVNSFGTDDFVHLLDVLLVPPSHVFICSAIVKYNELD